jgi:hypothetical protein
VRKGVEASLRVVKYLLVVLILFLLVGCVTNRKPKHPSDRRWYQGEVENEERAFFLDGFFGGR